MATKLTPEQLAKLPADEREVILEEREKKTRSIIILIFALVSIGGFALPILIPSDKERIEKSIEQYDFAKARKILAGMESPRSEEAKQDRKMLSDKITQAEITYFLDEGDYLKAYDSAKDGGKIAYYQSMVISRIPRVYEQKGASALIQFLGSIVFPDNSSWNYTNFVNSYNMALSNLIKAIEVEGKKEEATVLKSMLK